MQHLLPFLFALAGCGGPVCIGQDCETDEPGDTDLPPVDTDDSPDVPPEREILTVRSCDAVIQHDPPGSPSSVEVAGEFTDWEPQPMEGPNDEGVFAYTVAEPAPGEYAYKFVYDGTWEGEPPLGFYTKWSGDSENRNLRVGDCSRPLLQTVSASATSAGSLEVVVQVAVAADESAVDPDSVVATVGGNTANAEVDTDKGTVTISTSGLAPGKHSVRLWASDDSGRAAENEPLFVPLWVEAEPFEWEDGLIYFAFTDRFRNGDWGDEPFGPTADTPTCSNFQGGDFQGVIDAIDEDYFGQLGANVLWLSPIYDNPEGGYLGADGVHNFSGYHGYWPIDPLGIEERFGDHGAGAAERLHQLIARAHERGIRVMFDLVLNHVHEDDVYTREHPDWFGDGCTCGEAGCEWDVKPIECWFTPYLPDLDYKNHAITERVLADTLRLVEEFDVDAVRVDAAKHMDHVIMRSLAMRLRDDFELGGGAPFYVVGETFSYDPAELMVYVNPYELDGQFDFPTMNAVRGAFAWGGSFNDLEARSSTPTTPTRARRCRPSSATTTSRASRPRSPAPPATVGATGSKTRWRPAAARSPSGTSSRAPPAPWPTH